MKNILIKLLSLLFFIICVSCSSNSPQEQSSYHVVDTENAMRDTLQKHIRRLTSLMKYKGYNIYVVGSYADSVAWVAVSDLNESNQLQLVFAEPPCYHRLAYTAKSDIWASKVFTNFRVGSIVSDSKALTISLGSVEDVYDAAHTFVERFNVSYVHTPYICEDHNAGMRVVDWYY